MTHELKILPKYFDAVRTGIKPFEVRTNDRPFAVGDVLILREYENGEYTGGVVERAITYILDDPKYCLCGYVILGLKEV